jgi:hypothetical protein
LSVVGRFIQTLFDIIARMVSAQSVNDSVDVASGQKSGGDFGSRTSCGRSAD